MSTKPAPRTAKLVAMRTRAPSLALSRLRDYSAGLRCLSVKDPWITLIGAGVKRYEIRSQATNYRGWVVLCSSLKDADTREARAAIEAWKRLTHGTWVPARKGRALYLARLIDCVPCTRKHAKGACLPASALVGKFAWVFADATPLPHPWPVSGVLGLFYPPVDLVAYLRGVGKLPK